MDPLQFAAEDVLLLFAGGVVETFHTAYDRSFRTPAAWVGVTVEARKHDRLRFTVGRAEHPDQAIYGSGVGLAWTDITFELAAAEEPGMRAFFAAVAAAASRPGPA